MSSWKENLKNNLFIVLLSSVAISFCWAILSPSSRKRRSGNNGRRLFSDKPRTGLLNAAERLQARWSTAWSTPVPQLNKPPVRERNTVAG